MKRIPKKTRLQRRLTLSHHINQVAIYTRGESQLEWRETGQLPSPRTELKAAVVDNHIYVTGGYIGDDQDHLTARYVEEDYLTEILRWDPSTESWMQVGNFTFRRNKHAVVAIPSSIIESECSAMFLK